MPADCITNTASVVTSTATYPSNEVETCLVYDPIICKQVDKEIAATGDNLTYTVTIENPSRVPLSNVVFQDRLDDNLNYVYESFRINDTPTMPVIDGQTLSYTFNSIPPSTTLTITFMARIR